MMLGRALLIGLPIVLVLGAIGMRYRDIQAETSSLAGEQSKRKNAPLRADVAVAAGKTMVRSLELVGSVEAPITVRLSPKVSGRIMTISVREGASVTPGQALVTIDPTEIDAQVLEQRAAVAEAKARLAQAEMGVNSTDTSVAAQIRQQSAGLLAAQADVKQQEQSLKAQIAAANAQVVDSEARVATAKAQIETSRADLATARATRDNAKARADRAENLFGQGYLSAQERDNAVTALAVAESNVNGSQTRVDAAVSALASANAALASARSQASITKAKATADLTSARARQTQAAASRDVARANSSQSGAFRQNLDALRSAVAVAEAQLRQAESRRADTILRSPIAGVVTQRSGDPGSIANSGSEVLVISQLNPLFISVPIPVDQTAAVRVGMPMPVTFDALPGREFVGPIAEINPAADPSTRQFTVRIKLDNPDLVLKPGMYARTELPLSRTEARVYVPREAVREVKSEKMVYRVGEDGAVEGIAVQLGAEDAGGYEIKSGINPGDKFVALAYSAPKDGQKISPPKDEKSAGDKSSGEKR
jgi:membrane fusion protein (multidrug efflux system)